MAARGYDHLKNQFKGKEDFVQIVIKGDGTVEGMFGMDYNYGEFTGRRTGGVANGMGGRLGEWKREWRRVGGKGKDGSDTEEDEIGGSRAERMVGAGGRNGSVQAASNNALATHSNAARSNYTVGPPPSEAGPSRPPAFVT